MASASIFASQFVAVLLVLCSGTHREKQGADHYEERLAQMEMHFKKMMDHNERVEKMNQVQHLEIEELRTRLQALEMTCAPAPAKRAPADPVTLQTAVENMATQLDTVSAQVDALQSTVSTQQEALLDSKASTYVRWGHAQCPNDSELVYSGYVGGSHSQTSGAAANYLCLPQDPEYDANHRLNDLAQLYGGEYHTFMENTYLKDAVCAVCRAPRATTVMVVASLHCWDGWTLEYVGHLMAGRPDHAAASEFVCVDKALQSRSTANQNDDGKLLYYTATHCGSLPCPPYEDQRIVGCVVCSK